MMMMKPGIVRWKRRSIFTPFEGLRVVAVVVCLLLQQGHADDVYIYQGPQVRTPSEPTASFLVGTWTPPSGPSAGEQAVRPTPAPGSTHGVNLQVLEDGPNRPIGLDGSPVVPGVPADWWFDGGITAEPHFTTASGLYEDRTTVGMFSGTIDAVIVYTTADLLDADTIADPGLTFLDYDPGVGKEQVAYLQQKIMEYGDFIKARKAEKNYYPSQYETEIQQFNQYQDALSRYWPGFTDVTSFDFFDFLDGKVYDGVPLEITRSTVIRAIAIHTESMDSTVVETRILIKNLAPIFSIFQGSFNDSVSVTITATSAETSTPPAISVTTDGTEPVVGAQLGFGSVTLELRRTAVLRAIAYQESREPSNISHTGVLAVTTTAAAWQQRAQSFRSSLGWWILGDAKSFLGNYSNSWWSLGDAKYFFGNYSRERVRWGGACDEQHPTDIFPAKVAMRDGVLGPAVLTGPGCKGGLWDVDPRGVTLCDIHPLRFNGSLGSSAYSGRVEQALRPTIPNPSPVCAARRQPNLEMVAVVYKGVPALRFDGVINSGVRVADSIEALVRERRLPTHAFSLEIQMTIAGATAAGRHVRALAAAAQDTAGFVSDAAQAYSKGWALLYETNSAEKTVSIRFLVSLAANNDVNNRGRMASVSHTLAAAHVEDTWTHLVAVYDLQNLSLFINGSLASTVAACGRGGGAAAEAAEGGCGSIVYPVSTDPQARGEATPLTLGMFENRLTGLSVAHVGLLAEVRLLGEALPERVIAAGAARLQEGNPDGYCLEGFAGAYQGLAPCQECAAGSYTKVPARDACDMCPRGTWQNQRARTQCMACPQPGGLLLTTAAPGAASVALCVEHDECASWSGRNNTCHPNATCTKVPLSHVCTCNAGFVGDGRVCAPKCGDGVHLALEGEACDDGNTLDSDGCSSSCTVDEGFNCSPTTELLQVLRNEVHQPYSRTPSLGEDGLYEAGVDSIVSAEAQALQLQDGSSTVSLLQDATLADWCVDSREWRGPAGDGCGAYSPGSPRSLWCERDGADAANACPYACASCTLRMKAHYLYVSTAASERSVCECVEDGEVCCARAYVRCLLAARRFTPQSYQEPSPGLDGSGCVKPLIANTSWHLGSPTDDCDTTCARLAPPDPLLGGAWECVAHSGYEAQKAFMEAVSLPAAVGAQARCARVVSPGSNTGVAVKLSPLELPMADEFSVSGVRVSEPAARAELVCYASDGNSAKWAPKDEAERQRMCATKPSVATGRRLCQCRPPANTCSRDCLEQQAVCNANVAARAERLAESYEVLNLCSDNPEYTGAFYDRYTLVNATFGGCLDVGRFLNHSMRDSTLNLTMNNTPMSTTLRERFLQSAACDCASCPVTCSSCARCYREGGQYWYGAQEKLHPTRQRHPQEFHGVAAALMASSCAPADAECRGAGCKKALAYCGSHGLTKCLNDSVCWGQVPHGNACPSTYETSIRAYRMQRLGYPLQNDAKEGDVLCECMGWFHNCLLDGGESDVPAERWYSLDTNADSCISMSEYSSVCMFWEGCSPEEMFKIVAASSGQDYGNCGSDISSADYIAYVRKYGDITASPLGLKWKVIGAKPATGTEIQNELLAAALQTKVGSLVEFKKEEWDKFQIPELSRDSYIKAGNRYFILN